MRCKKCFSCLEGKQTVLNVLNILQEDKSDILFTVVVGAGILLIMAYVSYTTFKVLLHCRKLVKWVLLFLVFLFFEWMWLWSFCCWFRGCFRFLFYFSLFFFFFLFLISDQASEKGLEISVVLWMIPRVAICSFLNKGIQILSWISQSAFCNANICHRL